MNVFFFSICAITLVSSRSVSIYPTRKFTAGQRDLGGGSHSGEFVQSGRGVAPHDGGGEWPAGSGAAHGGEERRHRQTRRRPRVDCIDASHLPRVSHNTEVEPLHPTIICLPVS